MDAPTLADVLAARRRIRAHLDPSPLRSYPSIDRLVGAEVWVKHENLLPTGAFKVRGGVNLMSQLDAQTRARGVISASTGNHGQSIAFAARLFGVSAIICAPENANPVKVEAMRDLGAEVVLVGEDFDDAREHCERLAREHGYRYIHSGNEPDLIAGVGTHTLEVLEERPDIEVVIVPIGGGSGASGACIAGKSIRPELEDAGALLRELAQDWGPDAAPESEAKRLASALLGTTPVVHGAGPTAAVARRWKTQINENASAPAFWSELPEADHNEVCGYAPPLSAVFLDDPALDPRVRRRIELTAEVIAPGAAAVEHVEPRGETPAERVLSLVLLGDLVSIYLSALLGVDPSPMEPIERLKELLR